MREGWEPHVNVDTVGENKETLTFSFGVGAPDDPERVVCLGEVIVKDLLTDLAGDERTWTDHHVIG